MNTSRSILFLGSLTGLLWVVPSVGTQGMGTIGARVVHTDAVLVDTGTAPGSGGALLVRADDVAESAVGIPLPPV